MEGLKDRKLVGLVECDYLATSPPTILVSFSFTTDSRLLIAVRNIMGEMVWIQVDITLFRPTIKRNIIKPYSFQNH